MRLRGELGGGEINISVRLSRPSGLHLTVSCGVAFYKYHGAPVPSFGAAPLHFFRFCRLFCFALSSPLTSHRSSRPALRASLFHRYRPVGAVLPVSNHHQPSAAHLADDLAPLGLCCKNIIIACLFIYSTYYLLQLCTWLMISPRWGCAAKT